MLFLLLALTPRYTKLCAVSDSYKQNLSGGRAAVFPVSISIYLIFLLIYIFSKHILSAAVLNVVNACITFCLVLAITSLSSTHANICTDLLNMCPVIRIHGYFITFSKTINRKASASRCLKPLFLLLVTFLFWYVLY